MLLLNSTNPPLTHSLKRKATEVTKMNFNLNTLSTANYVPSQFSLNKLLNQNNNNMVPGNGGNAAVGNPNLAPRFLAMNNGSNGPANQPNPGNGNNLGERLEVQV